MMHLMYNGTDTLKVLGKTELKVSRLGLGTAEIGFAYGLGSPELPQEADALALLADAVEAGVIFFDTANYYGLAEERIGKSGIMRNPDVVVCTKCAQFLEKGEYFTPAELEAKIREQVQSSLRTLGLSALPLLLLHGPSAQQLQEGTLTAIVKKLQNEGSIRSWGASTRGEEPALAAIAAGADAIEVAYNIADQRMARRVFPAAAQKGVGVINRSVYLKGAFAGKAGHLPDSLAPLKAAVASAQSVADRLGIPLPELALRFALSESAINVSLIGTAKREHLISAVQALAQGPLPEAAVAALRALAIETEAQVDPAQWPK